jgi:hypothetical protein
MKERLAGVKEQNARLSEMIVSSPERIKSDMGNKQQQVSR